MHPGKHRAMAANLKARIAALKSTVAGGASGQATLARTNAWRAWAESQSKDIVTFCEYALEELSDANDPQHSGHSAEPPTSTSLHLCQNRCQRRFACCQLIFWGPQASEPHFQATNR